MQKVAYDSKWTSNLISKQPFMSFNMWVPYCSPSAKPPILFLDTLAIPSILLPMDARWCCFEPSEPSKQRPAWKTCRHNPHSYQPRLRSIMLVTSDHKHANLLSKLNLKFKTLAPTFCVSHHQCQHLSMIHSSHWLNRGTLHAED